MRAGLLTTSTSADVYSEAEPLGGFLHQASPDPRVVRTWGIALSHQRAGCRVQCCIRGRYRPREEHGLGACDAENRGRLGRDLDQGLT